MAEGRKDDGGKVRFDLLPLDAIWEVGKVYTMGASKYEDRNWESGIKYGRIFAAICRHLFKWWCGERYDQEDGQNHLSSVVWGALALLHYDLNPDKYANFDDRPEGHVRVWDDQKEVKISPEKNAIPEQLTLPLGISYGGQILKGILSGNPSLNVAGVGSGQKGRSV